MAASPAPGRTDAAGASDTVVFRGRALHQRLAQDVTDLDAMRAVAREPHRFRLGAGEGLFGFDLFKARDVALEAKVRECGSLGDPAVQDIVASWCALSGLSRDEAAFWRDAGFRQALRDGHDIQLHRYLGDDGWAWIAVRDMAGGWLSRKRLPESLRAQMAKSKARRAGPV